jgi:hypothetical protein
VLGDEVGWYNDVFPIYRGYFYGHALISLILSA